MKELIEGENLLDKFEIENDVIILTDKRLFFNQESYPLRGILSVTSKKEELLVDGSNDLNFWGVIIGAVIFAIAFGWQYYEYDLGSKVNVVFWLVFIINFVLIFGGIGLLVKNILIPIGAQNKKQEFSTFTVLLQDGSVLIKKNYGPEFIDKINQVEKKLLSLIA